MSNDEKPEGVQRTKAISLLHQFAAVARMAEADSRERMGRSAGDEWRKEKMLADAHETVARVYEKAADELKGAAS